MNLMAIVTSLRSFKIALKWIRPLFPNTLVRSS